MASPFKFDYSAFASQSEDSFHDIFSQFMGAPSDNETEAAIAAASAKAATAQARSAEAAVQLAKKDENDRTLWYVLGAAAVVVVLVVVAKK